jgi:hypothetical protein
VRFSAIASVCLLAALAAVMFLAGCVAPGRTRLTICPGKANVDEALTALAAHAQHAVPLKANGQILLKYHEPDSKKEKRHNLPTTLLFNPPWETYIQGSIAADVKAVIIGSNKESFWLALRPQEMSSLYLGQWTEARTVEGLMMSPMVVLEAFGIIVDSEPNEGGWSLRNEGAFDILTRRNGAGRLVKRVYVYACDYLVHKIEYFDDRQKVAAVAELGQYKPVAGSFTVPTRVRVSTIGPTKQQDSIMITLTSLTSMKDKPFNEAQKRVFFNPPGRDNFKHMYALTGGRWVRQR